MPQFIVFLISWRIYYASYQEYTPAHHNHEVPSKSRRASYLTHTISCDSSHLFVAYIMSIPESAIQRFIIATAIKKRIVE